MALIFCLFYLTFVRKLPFKLTWTLTKSFKYASSLTKWEIVRQCFQLNVYTRGLSGLYSKFRITFFHRCLLYSNKVYKFFVYLIGRPAEMFNYGAKKVFMLCHSFNLNRARNSQSPFDERHRFFELTKIIKTFRVPS